MENEEEMLKQKDPSYRSIPRFYQGGRQRQSEESLFSRARREARQRFLERKQQQQLDDTHVPRLLTLLNRHSKATFPDGQSGHVIDYLTFLRIKKELVEEGERFESFFQARRFLSFDRDPYGSIAVIPFTACIIREVNVRQVRIQLSQFDTYGDGYLRERDIENYVFDLIPTLPQLSGELQEDFYPYYVFTAVRKFFFFLDPKRTGKIYIRDLLMSPILAELLELRQEELPERVLKENWFSHICALRVYSMYLELDADTNGMLLPEELQEYGSGMLSEVFIRRVFQECQTYEGEMDYKSFLDFVLAMENKKEKAAMLYFWRILDIHRKGGLDTFTINYFFRSVVDTLRRRQFEPVNVEDVKDEIFDMIKPKLPMCIQLEDLLNSQQGHTVVSMLIDAKAFWMYDNRETLLVGSEEDEGAQEEGY